jgi:ferredoxin
MARLVFKPSGRELEVEANTKILVACTDYNIEIVYGCGAGRCGTCGVRVEGGEIKEMLNSERELLTKRGYPVDGSVRLACQARAMDGKITVDIGFQSE